MKFSSVARVSVRNRWWCDEGGLLKNREYEIIEALV